MLVKKLSVCCMQFTGYTQKNGAVLKLTRYFSPYTGKKIQVFFPPKPCTHLSPPHTRYMPRPSHSSRFYHPHNRGWAVQIMKLFIMKFSPLPCYLVSLRPQYSPQHPVIKYFLSYIESIIEKYKKLQVLCTRDIQCVHKRMVQIRKLTKNLFLILHG
jgi:hypothetical protein